MIFLSLLIIPPFFTVFFWHGLTVFIYPNSFALPVCVVTFWISIGVICLLLVNYQVKDFVTNNHFKPLFNHSIDTNIWFTCLTVPCVPVENLVQTDNNILDFMSMLHYSLLQNISIYVLLLTAPTSTLHNTSSISCRFLTLNKHV